MRAHLEKESEREFEWFSDGHGPPRKVYLDGLPPPEERPEPARARKARGRAPVDALAHEGLFLLLTILRAANAESLFDLYFKPHGVKWRTAMRRLHDLVAAGYLAHFRLDNGRCVYHLTEKTCSLTPNLALRAHSALYSRLPDRQAAYCWLRSTIIARLTAIGYVVGNDPAALLALRRFLIDSNNDYLKRRESETCKRCLGLLRQNNELRPTATELDLGYRFVCRKCGAEGVVGEHPHAKTNAICVGPLRVGPACMFDIAWKRSASATR
jgi:hypothetical protein